MSDPVTTTYVVAREETIHLPAGKWLVTKEEERPNQLVVTFTRIQEGDMEEDEE